MSIPTFSVIIPAFDEERLLPKCIASIVKANEKIGGEVEIVVADNQSTDRTAEIARSLGAKVVTVTKKVISAVRNGGAAVSTGKYLVFLDADDTMSDNMLVEIKKTFDTGIYIGGGTLRILSDRWSLGIALSYLLHYVTYPLTGASLFLFYTTREAFNAIGGFNEELLASEDWDFAMRLKRKGKERGLKYKNMFRASVTTSARKFDEFGDWFIFTNPVNWVKAIWFNNPQQTYDFWYRPRR